MVIMRVVSVGLPIINKKSDSIHFMEKIEKLLSVATALASRDHFPALPSSLLSTMSNLCIKLSFSDIGALKLHPWMHNYEFC